MRITAPRSSRSPCTVPEGASATLSSWPLPRQAPGCRQGLVSVGRLAVRRPGGGPRGVRGTLGAVAAAQIPRRQAAPSRGRGRSARRSGLLRARGGRCDRPRVGEGRRDGQVRPRPARSAHRGGRIRGRGRVPVERRRTAAIAELVSLARLEGIERFRASVARRQRAGPRAPRRGAGLGVRVRRRRLRDRRRARLLSRAA